MTDASNYGALSEGLRFYVAAMRRFIARTLREQHSDSDDWFEKQALATLPRYLRNPLRQRWLAHQRQRAADDQEGPEQLLDTSHFRHIISGHWDATYEVVFREQVTLHWIGEVAYWRNVWAHAADKADVEAERILDTCVRVVERFDPETAQRIEMIRGGLTAAPATDSKAATDQSSPPDGATDDGLTEAQNEETAPDVGRKVKGLDISGLEVTLSDLGLDVPELAVRGIDPSELGEPIEPEPPQDDALLELVREYWQYQRLLYLGEEGLADEDAATEIWAEAIPRLTLDLVQATLGGGGDWGVDSHNDPPIYTFWNASGIDVSIQIEFPKWALEDGV